ncbi:MAG TPA: type II secretion system protein GspM [Geminicoccaceae bacterium]|nr:type II secretion system protein GspM [Geminicoccaceae bacterium]
MISPLVSRFAALSLLAAVILAVQLFIVSPLLSRNQAADDAITEAAEMLTRLERVAAMRGQLEAQLSALSRRQSGQSYYLRERTDALAGASLQRRVKATIDSNGGQIRSIQVLPGQERSGLQRVGVRVQLMADIDALYRILHRLEVEPPLLFIESISVGSRVDPRRSRQRNADDRPLIVNLEVAGHLRGEGQ